MIVGLFNGLDWAKAVDPTLVSNTNLSSLSTIRQKLVV